MANSTVSTYDVGTAASSLSVVIGRPGGGGGQELGVRKAVVVEMAIDLMRQRTAKETPLTMRTISKRYHEFTMCKSAFFRSKGPPTA